MSGLYCLSLLIAIQMPVLPDCHTLDWGGSSFFSGPLAGTSLFPVAARQAKKRSIHLRELMLFNCPDGITEGEVALRAVKGGGVHAHMPLSGSHPACIGQPSGDSSPHVWHWIVRFFEQRFLELIF